MMQLGILIMGLAAFVLCWEHASGRANGGDIWEAIKVVLFCCGILVGLCGCIALGYFCIKGMVQASSGFWTVIGGR